MKILIGIDGSNASRQAFEIGLQHARAMDASIHLVTSMEKGGEGDIDTIQGAEQHLDRLLEECAAEGIDGQKHLLIRGLSPGEDLVEFAKEKDVGEVVIGVRRRSKVGKIVFGSTAQYVILRAHCPVVSVK